MGLEALKPMQREALEAYAKTNDLILLSPTGSGKTLAFLLPLSLDLSSQVDYPQALIIAPSRELALQIERVFRSMQTWKRTVCCYGGQIGRAHA